MSAEYPPTIDLTPTSEGVFIPDFESRPRAPIEIYEPPVDPASLNQLPPPAPRYDSGSNGLSDADLDDFGTDAYGRPVVTRNPVTGRPEFNPEVDYSGNFSSPRSSDILDDLPDSRRTRNAVGGGLGALGPLGDALELAGAAQNLTRGAVSGLMEFSGAGDAYRQWLHDTWPSVFRNPSGGPSGTIRTPGEPEFEGGQCDGVLYVVPFEYERPNGSVQQGGTQWWWGPVGGIRIVPYQSGTQIQILSRGQWNRPIRSEQTWIPVVTAPQETFVRATIKNLTRQNGSADTCGNPPGPATDRPTAPPTTPTTDYPPDYDYPEPESPPTLDPPPDSIIDPPPDIEGPEIPDIPETDRPPENEVDPPPEVPEENEDGPPTKKTECCPATSLKLDEVLRRLDGEGKGTLDITPCEAEEGPTEVDYGGFGLSGLYSAIAALTESLNFIAANTKCPPEVSAALPMFWEAKVGEIPQLIVIWREVESSSSNWQMAIPHPRPEIDQDYVFDFPVYTKGKGQATLRLLDNSKVIVNANSKADAEVVLSYVYNTLIDVAFLPKFEFTYTELIGDIKQTQVKASYVKKFEGHRNIAPLWATRLARD